MRKLTLLISAICCILFVSCTTKETIINNYNTSSPIDDNWIVINDPYGASHGQFFITQNGGLFLICYNPHFKSFDGGKTWTKFTMDSIYNFAFYEGKNNIIYDFNPVSYPEIFDKLVMKSTDEGNTWLKINYPAIDTTGKKNLAVNSFDVCKNGDLLLVYNWNTYNYNDYNMCGCMFRSKDDGNSWSIVKNGNDSLNQIYFIRTGSKDHIYAQQSYYNKKTYSYDYRYISSTDNGYNWQTGSDNLFVYASIIDSAGIIYQRNKVGISKSTDNGYTYNALITGSSAT